MVAAGAGELRGNIHGQRLPIEGSVTGRVLRSQRAERIDNARDALTGSLELLAFPGRERAAGPARRSAGAPSACSPPTTASATRRRFDHEHERLLGAFAASAATAVATGRQVEEQRLRQSIEASEQERRRWARELHDETLQSLAGTTPRAVLRDARQRRRPEQGDRGGRGERHRGDRQPALADRRAAPGGARRVRHRGGDREPRRAHRRARRASPSRRTSTSPSSAGTSRRATPRSSRARPTGSCRRR